MSYGRLFQKFGSDLDNRFTEWLYGPYDKQKLAYFEFLYSIYGVRNYIDYKLDLRADQEYFNRYNMDYTDIHDPRKLKQVSSGSNLFGSVYRMVSRNIDMLYDDSDKKKKK